MPSSAAKQAIQGSPKPKFTLEEFFDFEFKATGKHEFINGQIRAMAYTSPAHGTIQTNLMDELAQCLKAKGCKRYTSDRMVLVPDCQKGIFYPDLVVICGEEEFHTHKKKMQATLNPSLIIEILSHSTEEMDRTEKWGCYQKIKSLKQYILIEQNRQAIHNYRRKSESDRYWDYNSVENHDEVIEILDCPVRVREIYAGV